MQPPFVDEDVYSEQVRPNGSVRKAWKVPISMSDAVDVFYDSIHDSYVCYGKCWIQGPDGALTWKHGMARTESKDFIHWSDAEIILTPDDLDSAYVEFHTVSAFFYKDCYFCFNQILDREKEGGVMNVELMVSRDGFNWQRPFRDTYFIPRNKGRQFDSGSIFTNSTPVILEDEIRFYYGGYDKGAIGGGAWITGPEQKSGVGFASIPLDRFAGIRPVKKSPRGKSLKKPLENIGQVTLKPMSLKGYKQITLNADVGRGTIRVEILNNKGYRIRGYSKDDAIAIKGDSLRHKVAWKDRSISQLPPGEYMLRIHLDNAEIFALTIK